MNSTVRALSSTGMSGTPRPNFGGAGRGTVPANARPAQGTTQITEPDLAQWLVTPEARALEGTWVLLTNEYAVIDSDLSPSDLIDRHPEEQTPYVVYVEPGGYHVRGYRLS